MRKIDKASNLIHDNQDIFKCPLCGHNMFIIDTSMVCNQRHCYDLAKTGYLNLLPQAERSVYSKALFLARKKVVDSGFFDPLLSNIRDIIQNYSNDLERPNQFNVLDAGCGEGSHLVHILELLGTNNGCTLGIDISKEGIRLATNISDQVMWCVADLANLPLKDQSFDVILNVLSPANYGEFFRVLKQKGLLIKVVPGVDYLQEIRDIAYQQSEKNRYSNKNVIDVFKSSAALIHQEEIRYTVCPDVHTLKEIIQMTPLTLDKDVQDLCNVFLTKNEKITVSFNILVGFSK